MGRSRRQFLNTSFFSHSALETFEQGKEFGQQIIAPTVICFFGELATGKTTFIKGIVSGFAHIDPTHVQSPTFTYLHIYEGSQTVYHFDLYRLRDMEEFLSMGFEEYFDKEGICCVEWSEKISSFLPPQSILVQMKHLGGDLRSISTSLLDLGKNYV